MILSTDIYFDVTSSMKQTI